MSDLPQDCGSSPKGPHAEPSLPALTLPGLLNLTRMMFTASLLYFGASPFCWPSPAALPGGLSRVVPERTFTLWLS